MTYYIRVDDDFLILDAHTDIQVTYPARTTSHPTQARKTASDNYILDNPTASFTGIVSDVQSPLTENKKGAGEYINRLLQVRDSRIAVKFKHRLDGEEEDNWFITSFTPSQNNRNGYGGTTPDEKVIQSFGISITLERVAKSKGLVTLVEVPKAYLDGLQKRSEGTGSTNSMEEDKENAAINKHAANLAAAKKKFSSVLEGSEEDN